MALTPTEEALVRQLLDQQAAILSLAGNEATITSKLGATKVTLSDLNAASSVGNADLFLLRQGTSDKSVTAGTLGLYLGNSIDTVVAPDSTTATLQETAERLDPEYDTPAYSISAAAVQTGPMIVDMSKKLRITGNPADASYNNNVLSEVLAGLPNGAELEFPSRGMAYVEGGLIVDSTGVCFRGRNSGAAYDSFWLASTNTTGELFALKKYGFHAHQLIVRGPSNPSTGFGNDVTCDAFSFEPQTVDMDAVFTDCGILFYRDCLTVKNKPARNIRVTNTLFSGSSRAFSYTDVTSSEGRDIELYGNRYHGIGREAHSRSAVVYIEPASNVRTVLVQGGMSDFSVEVFRGYAGSSQIDGVISKGGQRGYVNLSSLGYTQPEVQKGITITNGRHRFDTTFGLTLPSAAISLAGVSGHYEIDGFVSYGSLGHGVYIDSYQALLNNITVHNAGQLTNNTYSGYHITSGASGTQFGGDIVYTQGMRDVPANKAKYAVENLGSDTIFRTEVLCHNVTAGIEYFIDPSKKSYGPDPRAYAYFKRIARGIAAPTTGQWNQGDVMLNMQPSAGGVSYWQCVTGGTPGVWKPVSVAA